MTARDPLDTAADYELTAAWCLTVGNPDAAEYLLTIADEIHAATDRNNEAAA